MYYQWEQYSQFLEDIAIGSDRLQYPEILEKPFLMTFGEYFPILLRLAGMLVYSRFQMHMLVGVYFLQVHIYHRKWCILYLYPYITLVQDK